METINLISKHNETFSIRCTAQPKKTNISFTQFSCSLCDLSTDFYYIDQEEVIRFICRKCIVKNNLNLTMPAFFPKKI